MQQEAMVSNCSKTWRIQNSVWTSGQQTLFTLRVASVYLPFFFRLLLDEHLKISTFWNKLWHVSKEMFGCAERDVAFHWPCDQVYGSCCQPMTFLGETVCRSAVHALHTESLSKEKRQSSPFGHKWLSSVYPSVFLPFFFRDLYSVHYLRLLFRFSSVSLPGLRVQRYCYLGFRLLFRFSSVSLPGPCVFQECGFWRLCDTKFEFWLPKLHCLT